MSNQPNIEQNIEQDLGQIEKNAELTSDLIPEPEFLNYLKSSKLKPSDVDLIPPLIHSLITLMNLHGKSISPQLLLKTGLESNYLSSISSCVRAMSKFGFTSKIVKRKKLGDISRLTLPCVLLLSNENACVLVSMDQEQAQIILPELAGPQSVSLADLEQEYLSYAIFTKQNTSQDSRVKKHTLSKTKRWFWDVILHYLPIYKHVFFASIFINLISIVSSVFAMNIYDRIVPNNAIESLWAMTIGILMFYSFDLILRNLRSYFVDVAGRNADVVLSSKLIDKVLSMRYDRKPESTGALVNNIREFENLREFFSSSTFLAFVDLPFSLLFLIIIYMIGDYLVIVPLITIPLMFMASLYFQNRSKQTIEHNFKQNMQKNALLVEMVNGLETIKTSSAEHTMLKKWEDLVGESALVNSVTRSFSTLGVTFSSFLSQTANVAMIVVGVYLISAGQLSMGALVACTILLGRTLAPMMQLASLISRLSQSRLALKSLDMLMETSSENSEDNPNISYDNLEPSVCFENVNFSYPQSKRLALEDINFTIKAGEKVGIVGKMGSGKSTLGKLIVNLYEAESGTVRYADIDTRHLNTIDLRSRIGFLPQEIVLFYGTIKENIALGDQSVSDRLLLRAVELAGLSDFIRNNPAGFGANVGERGMNLSGGQRQSIALARTLLYDPDLVILDEPTSNMDNQSENIIKEKMRTMLSDKTLIVITHRISMLDLVDRIIVMDNGRIVADGPKDKILKVNS